MTASNKEGLFCDYQCHTCQRVDVSALGVSETEARLRVAPGAGGGWLG
jgi:hypothetical protein